jgi:hypothetical protein
MVEEAAPAAAPKDGGLLSMLIRVFSTYVIMSVVLSFITPRAAPPPRGGEGMLALEDLVVKPIMRPGDLVVRALCTRAARVARFRWLAAHWCPPVYPAAIPAHYACSRQSTATRHRPRRAPRTNPKSIHRHGRVEGNLAL